MRDILFVFVMGSNCTDPLPHQSINKGAGFPGLIKELSRIGSIRHEGVVQTKRVMF